MQILRAMFREGPIVEIGSGHRPYPQSHVLVDKLLDESEREGPLRTDRRPLLIADIENLPLKDNAFTYSICSHVLEHAGDVAKAIGELERVSRSGYIETPSALFELIEPHRRYHKWTFFKQDQALVIRKKDQGGRFRQSLLSRLTAHNWAFQLFCATNQELKKTILEWNRRIPFEITERPFHPDDYVPFSRRGPTASIRELWRWMQKRANRRLAMMLGPLRPRFPLEPLLLCSICRGNVRVEETRVTCDRCDGCFRRDGNIFYLAPEYLIKNQEA